MVATGTFSFGERLRAARESCGLSREALGEALGRTAQAVATWERGTNRPHRTTLVRLASTLGTTVEELDQ